MATFPTRPQPYRLKWPWTAAQVENTDEMFEILFKRTKRLADSLADLIIRVTNLENLIPGGGGSSFSTSTLLGIGQPGADGDPGIGFPGPPGAAGRDGVGIPGIPGEDAPGGGTFYIPPTINASALVLGTLSDLRLSANVPLLNVANIFTAVQTINTAGAVLSLATAGFIRAASVGLASGAFVDGFDFGGFKGIGYDSPGGFQFVLGGYRAGQWNALGLYTSGAEALHINTTQVISLPAYTATTFVAGDFFLVVDAAGVVHRSSLGPAA